MHDTVENLNKLKNKYGNRCLICGKTLSDFETVIDHIKPRSMGGTDDLDNLILTCKKCNYTTANNIYGGIEFERYIEEIIHKSKKFRNTQSLVKFGNEKKFIADIVTERKIDNQWERLIIEVKYASSFINERIHAMIAKFKEMKPFTQNEKFVLLFPGKFSQSTSLLFKQNHIEVWDLSYLLTQFEDEIKSNPHPIFTKALLLSNRQPPKTIEDVLIAKIKECKLGQEDWVKYQKLTGEILSHLFCPPLSQPLSESSDAPEVNRRDFIFPNYCETGFWSFLRENYSADYIVVDAKNYTGSIEKPEVLQIANYLKHYGTGLFAIIISRNGASDSALHTIKEKWIAERKLIVVLQDSDIEQMLIDKKAGNSPEIIIRQKIENFRISL